MKLTKEQLIYEKWVTSVEINGNPVDLFANPTDTDRKNILSQMAKAINIGVTKDGVVFIWDSKYDHPTMEREINKKSKRPISFVWLLTYHEGVDKIALGTNTKPDWVSLLSDDKVEKVLVQIKNAFPGVESINGTLKLK